MIMHAREIPECILSLKALKIDKVWFRGYTEKLLEIEITEFIKKTDYDYYVLVSDDVIATQFALENLLKFQTRAKVVTGWCNIFPGQTLSNLELKPIIESKASLYIRVRDQLPKWSLKYIKVVIKWPIFKQLIQWPIYNHFPLEDEIWSQAEVFRTYFVGWALTSIDRATWLKYGFRYPFSQKAGHGSDRAMSSDLLADNEIALCARDSFIYHLGTTRNFIVGKVKPEVIFDPMELVLP
jgi:hypothetical protein